MGSKRIFALLLAVVMLVSMLPVGAAAAESAPVALELDKSIYSILDSGAAQEYTYTAAESGYYIFTYDERRFDCAVSGMGDLVRDLAPYGTVLNSGYIEKGETATFCLINYEAVRVGANVSMKKAPAITNIVFENNEVKGLESDVLHIPFSIEPDYARGELSWAVDDLDVAQVTAVNNDSVEVVLLSDGTATLTATADSGATENIRLLVEAPMQLQIGVNQVDMNAGEEKRVVFTPAADGYYYFRMEEGPQELNIFDPDSEEVLVGSWNCHDLNSAWGEDGQYFCAFLNVGVQYSARVYEYMGEDRTVKLEIGQMSVADSVGAVEDQRLAFTDTIPVAFGDVAPTDWVSFTWSSTDTSVAVVERMEAKGFWLHGVNPGKADIDLNVTLADGSVQTQTCHVIVDDIDAPIALGQTANVTVQPRDVYIYGFTPNVGDVGTYYYCAKVPEGVRVDIVGGWMMQYPNGEYRVLVNDYDYQDGRTHMLRLWSEADEALDVEVQLLTQVPVQGIQLPDIFEVQIGQPETLLAELQPMNTEFFQWTQWAVDDPAVVEIGSTWEEGGAASVDLVGLQEGTTQVRITVGMADGTVFTDTCQVEVKGLPVFPVGAVQTVTMQEYSQKFFALTPDVTGYYYFVCDQNGHIRFADQELECRDGWDTFTYRIYYLEAGKTYTLVLENGEGATLDVNATLMPVDAPDRIYCDDEKTVAVGMTTQLGYGFDTATQFALPSVSVADPTVVAVQHIDMHNIYLEGLAEGETELVITAGGAEHICHVKVQAVNGTLTQGVNKITLPACSTQYYTFTPGDVQRYVIWTDRADGELEMLTQCPGYENTFRTDDYMASRVSLDDPNGVIAVVFVNNRDEAVQIDVNLGRTVPVDGIAMTLSSYETIPGQMVSLDLFATPVDSEGLDMGVVTWDVADYNVLQPENVGNSFCELRALAAGTTVVTARLELDDGSVYTASAVVEVIQPPSLEEKVPLSILVTDQPAVYQFTPSASGLYNFSVESMDVGYEICRMDGMDQDWTWNDDHENGTQHLISELEAGVAYGITIRSDVPTNTTITVSPTPIPNEMWLHFNDLLVRPGTEFDLMAGFGPAATLEIVSWSSDDTSVVDIGYTGMAHAQLLFLQEGTATITAVTPSGHTAQCVVTVSNSAPVGPWIEEQPLDMIAADGDFVMFHVSANSLNGIYFEWYCSTDGGASWNPIPGADMPDYAVQVTDDMDGWQYRCEIWDDDNNRIVSDAATLSVEKVIAEGNLGDNYFWQIWNNGWLHIFGNGQMPNFNPAAGNYAPWHSYGNQVRWVDLSSMRRNVGVTSIGDYAFADMAGLEEITIPASVTAIGEGAFENTVLTTVYYYGSWEQWQMVEGTDALAEFEIVYDYGQETVDPFEQIDETHYRMVADYLSCEEYLEIPDGVEIDLNGHTLEVAGVAGFGTIVDSSEGCTGRLFAQEMILAQMAAMPIYDSNEGCYRFFDYQLNPLGCREKADGTVTFGLAIDFSCQDAYALLAGSENSGVQVRFGLWWQEEFVEFVIGDELLRQYAALQLQYPMLRSAMMLNVTGVDTLESGTEICLGYGVDTAGDVTATGENMYYVVS